MLTRRLARSLALAGALAAPASALDVVPVFNANVSAGQYFFGRERGSLAANAAVVAAPMMRLSPRWSLMPMYSGSYRGTKGIDDGVGASSLFQQSMDHRLSVTGFRSLEGTTWRLKPQASYKREFLKETRNEDWGRGLFDYEKIGVGFEAENVYKDPFSFRAALDMWRTRFPHYESLESRSGVDPNGNPLGRELAPRRVLDTWNTQLTLSGSRPLPAADPRYALSASWSLMHQAYADQRLVNEQGQFDGGKRRDILNNASLNLVRPTPVRLAGQDMRLDLSGGVSAAWNISNQNSFDAGRLRYIADSYSWWSFGLGPAAALSWGDRKAPERVSMGLRWSRLQYTGRLAQAASGAYNSAKQRQDRTTLSLGFDHPLAPRYVLQARINALWATSNQKFEQNYTFNYRTMTYHVGVAFEL